MNNVINLVKLSFNNFLSIKKLPIFIISAFCISSLFSPSFSIMLIGITTYVVAYQTMAYEDSYGIDYLISYLPVSKNQYVLSRYILGLLSIVLACVIFIIISFISMKFNLVEVSLIDYKMNLIMGIISSVVLISILIPILLYFGMKKGRMAMMLIFMVIIMVPNLVISSGDIDIISVISKINEMNTNILSIIITTFMLVISYLISIKLYKSKEITL